MKPGALEGHLMEFGGLGILSPTQPWFAAFEGSTGDLHQANPCSAPASMRPPPRRSQDLKTNTNWEWSRSWWCWWFIRWCGIIGDCVGSALVDLCRMKRSLHFDQDVFVLLLVCFFFLVFCLCFRLLFFVFCLLSFSLLSFIFCLCFVPVCLHLDQDASHLAKNLTTSSPASRLQPSKDSNASKRLCMSVIFATVSNLLFLIWNDCLLIWNNVQNEIPVRWSDWSKVVRRVIRLNWLYLSDSKLNWSDPIQMSLSLFTALTWTNFVNIFLAYFLTRMSWDVGALELHWVQEWQLWHWHCGIGLGADRKKFDLDD